MIYFERRLKCFNLKNEQKIVKINGNRYTTINETQNITLCGVLTEKFLKCATILASISIAHFFLDTCINRSDIDTVGQNLEMTPFFAQLSKHEVS